MTKLTWGSEQLVFDAVTVQEHARDADVTQHPVETGASVTDHIIAKPRDLKLQGTQENGDLAWATLNRLMDTKQVVTVKTSLGTYTGMVLMSLAAPKNAAVGKALRFTATFRKIVFAESQRIQLEVPAAKVDRGKQGTPETKPETKAKVTDKVGNKSFAIQGGEKIQKGLVALFRGG